MSIPVAAGADYGDHPHAWACELKTLHEHAWQRLIRGVHDRHAPAGEALQNLSRISVASILDASLGEN